MADDKAGAEPRERDAATEDRPTMRTWIGAGVGAGIGSAAIAAALLYATRSRRKKSAAKD